MRGLCRLAITRAEREDCKENAEQTETSKTEWKAERY